MKKTFILIHGAWHTKKCWDKISPILSESGNHVIALDLPGHGDHKEDFSSISMRTYVDKIIEVISSLNERVILVGHSMAGMVISQVAELVPSKIETLVYVTGFLPQNGDSLGKIVSQFTSHQTTLHLVVDEEDRSISVSASDAQKLFYNCCSKDDEEIAIQLLQKQPLKPFSDEVVLTENFKSIPKIFVECLKDKAILPEEQKFMYSRESCTIHTLKNADHSPFYSQHKELAEILLKGGVL